MAKPTTYEVMQERLADLKRYLLDEQRSSKPSERYVSDLNTSIKLLENDLVNFHQPYQIVGNA